MARSVDVAIVGAGTAGLSALREVRRATESFVIIDAGDWGTTCAARGCMPSKALIEATNAFHRRHAFAAFGIAGAEGLSIDIPAVLARVRGLRDGFVKGPQSTPETLGARAISGRARLLGPDRLEVNGEEIAAARIILAPGSAPIVPKPWTQLGTRVLTTDTLFEQPDLPRRIAVVGLGAIGLEMAQALARLGIEVAGFDATDRLPVIADPEVATVLHELLAPELRLHLGTEVDLDVSGDGLLLTWEGGALQVDAVLAALGRRPNLAGLGIETLGVDLNERGLPPVNPETLQIADLPVWLAGDANGDRAILHEAADEGHIAGRNAVADHIEAHCRRTALSIVFCSPQLARVGPPLSALDPETTEIGSADFRRQGRARTAATAQGVLRVYGDRRTGRLLGAEMAVPAAEHMAHLLALAVERGLTVRDVLAAPFYHPVLEEGLRSALRALARKLPDAGGSDLSACPEVGHDALD